MPLIKRILIDCCVADRYWCIAAGRQVRQSGHKSYWRAWSPSRKVRHETAAPAQTAVIANLTTWSTATFIVKTHLRPRGTATRAAAVHHRSTDLIRGDRPCSSSAALTGGRSSESVRVDCAGISERPPVTFQYQGRSINYSRRNDGAQSYHLYTEAMPMASEWEFESGKWPPSLPSPITRAPGGIRPIVFPSS